MAKMKLMTKQLRKQIPPIRAQDGKGDEAIVYAKFFNPCGAATWYITEFDGSDELFGYANLQGEPGQGELGYMSLSEFENIRLSYGLFIERDRFWSPTRLGDVKSGKKT